MIQRKRPTMIDMRAMLNFIWPVVALLVTVFAVILLLSGYAAADVCAQRVVGHCNVAPVVAHHAVVQKAVVHDFAYQAPIVNYFVGAPVRQEALVAQAVQQALAGLEGRIEKRVETTTNQYRYQQQPVQQYHQPQQYAQPLADPCPNCNHAPPPNPLPPKPVPDEPQFNFTAPHSTGSLVEAACLKCHGGESVQAGLDFRDALDLERSMASIRAVLNGSMPKGGAELTTAERQAIAAEIAMSQ